MLGSTPHLQTVGGVSPFPSPYSKGKPLCFYSNIPYTYLIYLGDINNIIENGDFKSQSTNKEGQGTDEGGQDKGVYATLHKPTSSYRRRYEFGEGIDGTVYFPGPVMGPGEGKRK
jgi:hypothetical protein